MEEVLTRPHVHAEVIKAWANGAAIEYFSPDRCEWVPTACPIWGEHLKFRVKPEPIIRFVNVLTTGALSRAYETPIKARLGTHPAVAAGMLKLTLDAEGKMLLDVEQV